MSVSKIDPTAPSGEEDWNNLNEWANLNAFGRDRVSLTEWDTSTIPEIEAGSLFETGGSLYQVDSDTSIGGSPSDGYCYILFNDTAETFSFTNTVPVWDASKYGYYDTATNYKAMPFKILKSGSDYNYKKIDDIERRIINAPEKMFETKFTSLKTLSANHTTSFSAIKGFSTVDYNLNSCFNNTDGIFTAPHDGLYSFTFNSFIKLSSTTYAYFSINKNDTTGFPVGLGLAQASATYSGKLYEIFSFSKMIYLIKSDTISLDYLSTNSIDLLINTQFSSTYPDNLTLYPTFECVRIS